MALPGVRAAASTLGRVLVVTRYRVASTAADEFRAQAQVALGVLATRPGFVDAVLGHNVDDPELWSITMTWRDIGSYRRSLSGSDVKMAVVPLLSRALDEPSAYETEIEVKAGDTVG